MPMPEESLVAVSTVRACQSVISTDEWETSLSGDQPLALPSDSSHILELQAEVHSTAFLGNQIIPDQTQGYLFGRIQV